MNDGVVNIIVPCYNSEKYLNPFLDSLKKQDYDKIRFIFVNDGSTDNTLDILREWVVSAADNPHRSFNIEVQNHLTQSAAVNTGLLSVDGEYLMLADSDDILPPDSVSSKVAALESNKELGYVLSDYEFLYDDGTHIAHKPFCFDKDREIRFKNFFTQQIPCLSGTYMVRTDMFFEIYKSRQIPFSFLGQNLQFILPMASCYGGLFLDKTGLLYRQHSDSDYHRAAGFGKAMERNEQLKTLLNDIIPFCSGDSANLRKLADELYVQNKVKIMKEMADKARKHINE